MGSRPFDRTWAEKERRRSMILDGLKRGRKAGLINDWVENADESWTIHPAIPAAYTLTPMEAEAFVNGLHLGMLLEEA